MIDVESSYIPDPDLNEILVPDYVARRQTLLPSEGNHDTLNRVS